VSEYQPSLASPASPAHLCGGLQRFKSCFVGWCASATTWETVRWSAKSFGIEISAVSLYLLETKNCMAQSNGSPAGEAGFSFEAVKTAIAPASDSLAYVAYALGTIWLYLMAHPPAAVMASAAAASIFALIGIMNQRATTRLRETFVTINSDNWDKDVIDSRKTLATIRQEIANQPFKISEYAVRTADNIPNRTTLQTIMNDYESLALGIRLNILDEYFMYRWMRGTVLGDWETLAPLVSAYRQNNKNPRIYIEFEGLSLAWGGDRSYRTGRKIRSASKVVSVR